MSMIKVRVPVDFVYSDELQKNVLKYQAFNVEEKETEKNDKYEKIIEDIFSVDDAHVIARKLRKLISDSYFDDELMRFLNRNQWILRFAYSNDVLSVMNDEDFHVTNVDVDFPYDCYIDSKVRKVFSKKVSLPIWREQKAIRTREFIEWLVLDDKNTLDEKIEAAILSNSKDIKELLVSYPWILMKVESKKRINIMRKLGIDFTFVDMIKGFNENADGSIEYTRETTYVPEDIALSYDYRNDDIKALVEEKTGTFDSRLLDYYYSHFDYKNGEDNNDLLRDNMWLLDHATSRTRQIITDALGLSETRRTVKFRTIEKRKIQNDFHSCAIDIDPLDLEHYENLNKQLLLLFSKIGVRPSLDEASVAEFIKSDEAVLRIWPWLIEYVTEPNYIVEILNSFDKNKKR